MHNYLVESGALDGQTLIAFASLMNGYLFPPPICSANLPPKGAAVTSGNGVTLVCTREPVRL